MASLERSGQLIVVDNNSSDKTAKLATRAGATVVFEATNQISRARNAGAEAADAAAYVFVDADSLLSPELLQACLSHLFEEDVVGGGALIAADRQVSWQLHAIMTLWNSLARFAKLAAGCFVFTRSDAFHAVGGFSQKRYAGEELELSRALGKWGRHNGMHFKIITSHRMITSMRKAEWYSTAELFQQLFLVMIPGALNSKRFLKTWYDDSTNRTRKSDAES